MKPIIIIAAVTFILVGAGLGVLFSSTTPTQTQNVVEGVALPEVESTSTTPSVSLFDLPKVGRDKPKPEGKPYNEIKNPSGFVNTEKITIGELVGKKVILVDFLTYSCINCQRTFPYINAWYDKYKEQGLEVVGIHTPEFAFERNIENVKEAMIKFGITHPVVLDNDYATWSAYGNRYWPRKYLIDIYGNVVYDHIGEGAYEETEKKIQELLKERAEFLGETAMKNSALVASKIPEAEISSGSPETYFGASRNSNFASGATSVTGQQTFSEPESEKPNMLYLPGTWNIAQEHAESVSKSRVHFLYTAKNAYFVAGAETANEMEVLLDGAAVPESKKGVDVYFKNGKSYVKIQKNQLYKIIEGSTRETHLLEFVIPQPGLKAFTFTFG